MFPFLVSEVPKLTPGPEVGGSSPLLTTQIWLVGPCWGAHPFPPPWQFHLPSAPTRPHTAPHQEGNVDRQGWGVGRGVVKHSRDGSRPSQRPPHIWGPRYLPDPVDQIPEHVGCRNQRGAVIQDHSGPRGKSRHHPVPHHPANLGWTERNMCQLSAGRAPLGPVTQPLTSLEAIWCWAKVAKNCLSKYEMPWTGNCPSRVDSMDQHTHVHEDMSENICSLAGDKRDWRSQRWEWSRAGCWSGPSTLDIGNSVWHLQHPTTSNKFLFSLNKSESLYVPQG